MTDIVLFGKNSFIGKNIKDYFSVNHLTVSEVSSRFISSRELEPNSLEIIFEAKVMIIVGWPLRDYSDEYFNQWSVSLSQLVNEFLAFSTDKYAICLGTCLEAGKPQDILITESSSISGITRYGRHKADFYKMLSDTITASSKKRLCWARIFGPTGKYEKLTRLFPSITMLALHNKPIQIHTPSVVRDYYHTDYLCESILRLITIRYFGLVNIGTGIPTSNLFVANQIKRLSSSASNISILHHDPTDCLDFSKAISRVASPDKLISLVGAIDFYSIKDIVKFHLQLQSTK